MNALSQGRRMPLTRYPGSRCCIPSGYGENADCVPSPGPDTILSAPKTPRVGTGAPDTDEETQAQRGEGMPEVKPKPCQASPAWGPPLCLQEAEGTMHINASLFGRCGAGEWRRSLSSPFSPDAGPLRQQAARACPGVTPRGGCGQEQGAHSAAAAASGQPTGWPGVGGREETDKGRERLGVGRAETETRRETKRQRDPETERQKGEQLPRLPLCLSGSPRLRV